ncbi:gp43 [Sphingomonas phage PAU]|uniref:gp43 n=1 Tax=Sphingomonas phage PAU TaxID=1150991 RepID=UPI0002573130|nr:gp43 [Sphingomonas phage PAU]AFF28041.1 gp43 [Sphingomonas phage PAU]
MKHITNFELNESLADIKQKEHTKLSKKVLPIVNTMINLTVLCIAIFMLVTFTIESLSHVESRSIFDKIAYVILRFLRSAVLIGSLYLSIKVVFTFFKYLYKKLSGGTEV